jgi:hypothetical protein
MGIYVTNLKQKLAETADNQRIRNTELLIEDLRKLAYEYASNGYKSMYHKAEKPVNWSVIKLHFVEQGLNVEVSETFNTIQLKWY